MTESILTILILTENREKIDRASSLQFEIQLRQRFDHNQNTKERVSCVYFGGYDV